MMRRDTPFDVICALLRQVCTIAIAAVFGVALAALGVALLYLGTTP